jgi:hypothetical protein
MCVRDGGAFVTSVVTAVPAPARAIAPQSVRVQPDAAALAQLAARASAGELTVRVARSCSSTDAEASTVLLLRPSWRSGR